MNIDYRILDSCFFLTEGLLSSIFLKNNAHFPWLILIPKQENVQELFQLSEKNQIILMKEITVLSTLMHHTYPSSKLNIGTLGNIVSQLHIHIIARFTFDPLWPQGVWQSSAAITPYPATQLPSLIDTWKALIDTAFKSSLA